MLKEERATTIDVSAELSVELWYRDVGLTRLMADVATIVRGMRPGEVLFLHTNTADAWEAVPAWCATHGHQIVWHSDTGEGTLEGAPTYRTTRYKFHLRKAGISPHTETTRPA